MRKLEIEIPDNKEIDWEASAEQKQVIFKDKEVLTYEDVCEKLSKSLPCVNFISADGCIRILSLDLGKGIITRPTVAVSSHQLECILAKNKLANVARYLNGKWDNFINDKHYIIWMNPAGKNLHIEHSTLSSEHSTIIFKSVELAQKAIEILGKETIQLALEPLY